MTDENKTLTWQELEEFRKEEAKPEVPADGLLRTLVKVADERALSVGVTLSVGGILISGLLIGHKEFMELFAKHWINSTEDEEAQQLRVAKARRRGATPRVSPAARQRSSNFL